MRSAVLSASLAIIAPMRFSALSVAVTVACGDEMFMAASLPDSLKSKKGVPSKMVFAARNFNVEAGASYRCLFISMR